MRSSREIPIFSEQMARIAGHGRPDMFGGRAISSVNEEGLERVREAIRLLHEKKYKLRILKPLETNLDTRGVSITELKPGEIHEVRLSHARGLIRGGWAEAIDELPELDDRPSKKTIEAEKKKLKEFSIGQGKKVRIRMVQTQDSSPDGVNVVRFYEGQICEVPEALAKSFIGSGWALMEEKNG